MERLTSRIMIEPVTLTAGLLWRESPHSSIKCSFILLEKNLNHNGFYAARSCIFLWSPFSSKYINFFVTSGYVMREPEALFWATHARDCRPAFLALFELKLTLIFILYFLGKNVVLRSWVFSNTWEDMSSWAFWSWSFSEPQSCDS